jgi:hypothetical protein
MPFGRQRLLPGEGACPRSSAGALKTDIDSEGALCAFAVVHTRGGGMGREAYGFLSVFVLDFRRDLRIMMLEHEHGSS